MINKEFPLEYFFCKETLNVDIKMFEDIKGVITIRKSKDTQRNCQKINNKRTNNDIQDTIQNTKD